MLSSACLIVHDGDSNDSLPCWATAGSILCHAGPPPGPVFLQISLGGELSAAVALLQDQRASPQ